MIVMSGVRFGGLRRFKMKCCICGKTKNVKEGSFRTGNFCESCSQYDNPTEAKKNHDAREHKPEKEDMWKCCICGKDCVGFGNNPEPIKDKGLCCDECNRTKVIPARLNRIG